MSSKLETEQFGQIVHWERDNGLRLRARGLSFHNPLSHRLNHGGNQKEPLRDTLEDRRTRVCFKARCYKPTLRGVYYLCR